MIFEKRWAAVPIQMLTANGTSGGILTVSDCRQCHVKQQIILKSNTQLKLLQINRITSKTQIEVGLDSEDIFHREDVSMFLTTDAAFFFANEQVRPKISWGDIVRAVFAEEPANAIRTIAVDELGNPYNESNPLPAAFDGTIEVGDVQVKGPNGSYLDPNTDGSVKPVALFTKPYDAMTATYPSATQETYSSRTGGVSGTIQQVVTVNYTDSTKSAITNAFRSFG